MKITEAQLERIQERTRGYWNTYIEKRLRLESQEAQRAEREARGRRAKIRRENTAQLR